MLKKKTKYWGRPVLLKYVSQNAQEKIYIKKDPQKNTKK